MVFGNDNYPHLFEEAEKSWRKIRGADKIEPSLKEISFKEGEPVLDAQPV